MDLNVKLTVSDGEFTVEREARVTDCAMAVTKDSEQELYYMVGRALREARRMLKHIRAQQ